MLLLPLLPPLLPLPPFLPLPLLLLLPPLLNNVRLHQNLGFELVTECCLDVQLDGSCSYLNWHPLLNKIGFCIHAALQALICVECQQGFLPSQVSPHFLAHGIKVTPEETAEIQSLVKSFNFHDSHYLYPVPQKNGPPVEMLLVQEGYACSFQGCQYALHKISTLDKHRSTSHGTADCRAVKASIQTLFSPLGHHFFAINPQLLGHTPQSCFSIFMSTVLPNKLPLTTQVPVEDCEITPFHCFTQWWEILGEHVLTKKSREAVISLVCPVERHEAVWGGLRSLCQQYLMEARALADAAGQKVKKVLVPEQ